MKIKPTQKEYTNGQVTIVWQPSICIHAENCWRGLPDVFNPKGKPWANPEGASTEAIKDQIDKCPSGALSYFMNADEPKEEKSESIRIDIATNGPLIIHGSLQINRDGNSEFKSDKTAFCRCGASENKPYCDGTHSRIGFKG